MNENNIYFFWKHKLSQWSIDLFESNNIIYNCGEQYMMAQKAILFRDQESFFKILKEQRPRHQQRLGRQIKNFNQEEWDDKKEEIVFKGNLERFSQNPDSLELLLSTGDSILAEASPYDKVWGIGLSENDPRALNIDQWKGQNLLGKALMKVRDNLKLNYETFYSNRYNGALKNDNGRHIYMHHDALYVKEWWQKNPRLFNELSFGPCDEFDIEFAKALHKALGIYLENNKDS